MVPLARRYLFAEKLRLLMSVAGVAFAVLLVLVIASLYRGWSSISTFFNDVPGELWVTQSGAGNPFRSSSLLPADAVGPLAALDEVAHVVPVFARTVTIPVTASGRRSQVFFLGIAAPAVVDGPGEGLIPRPGAIVIDDVLADDAGVKVGDTFHVLGRGLVVDGVRSGGNPLFAVAFLNGVDAAGLLGTEDYVSFYLMSARAGVDRERVTAAVRTVIADAEVFTSEDFASVISDEIDRGFLPVVGALVGIGLFVGGAVVALTTYTSTLERLGDYAVLKAVGASSGFVYRVVIQESITVGVFGSAVGVVLASVVASGVRRFVPEFVTDLRAADVAGIVGITLVVSLAAAVVPTRRINRIDPASVFRA
jgi:putative ABC transport system permease protein